MNPEDVVKYIKDAAYFLTDSFHCTAFSIQFQKNFMTFYRFAVGAKGGRNSRIDSLFNVLGVPRSHIYNGNISMVDAPIDWTAVDSKLCSFREESVKFLNSALI